MRLPALPALLLVLTTLPSPSAHAASWPQFRGPQAAGVDATHALPLEWSIEPAKNIRWQTPVPGLAHASPIVHGERIYLATVIGPADAELKIGLYGDIGSVTENSTHVWRVLALERGTGKVVWNVAAHEAVPRVKRHPKSTHCNPTPATDGKHLVAIFGSEGLFCFDLEGRLRWKKDLGPMDSGFFSVPSAQWGFASSPVIHDDRVIVQCDVQQGSFLAAFDVDTGLELWRTPRPDVPTWSCPTVIEHGGRKQIAVNGWKQIGGYDFRTGEELWRLKGGGDIPVPTPIFANGLIYLTSAHGGLRPMRAIQPDARGDITPEPPAVTNASIVWAHPRLGNYMQTPLAVSNWVFGCSDYGVLTCFDARTGEVRFSERLSTLPQGYSASPVSDGRHLFFPSETGKVIVVPVADQFSVATMNDLGETCMATPAIAEGVLFFRTRTKVVAVGRE